MKKLYTAAILLLILALAAACGPADGGAAVPSESVEDTTDAPINESEPISETAAEEAGDVVTDTTDTAEAPADMPDGPALVVWADSARIEVINDLAPQFSEELGIDIVGIERSETRSDFAIAAPAGEGPDIIIGAHDWIGELSENGLLAEIDLGSVEDQFLAAAVEAFQYDGAQYGMPYATENVAFVYNPELVTEVPTTWEEVRDLATQLEDEGTVEQGFIIMEGDPYHFYPIQTAFGGYVFGRNDQGYNPEDVGIDSEGSLAAAGWLASMVEEGHIQSNIDGDIMMAQFEGGNAAMMITGPWNLARLRESGVPYEIAPIPGQTEEAQPFLGVQGFMVSAFSEEPLVAEAFLTEFMASEEAMQAFFDADPRPSAYLPVRDAIEDPDIEGFAQAGANGNAMPAIPEMNSVWDSWGNALTLVFQQGEGPDEAFQTAAEQIRTAIGGQ